MIFSSPREEAFLWSGLIKKEAFKTFLKLYACFIAYIVCIVN